MEFRLLEPLQVTHAGAEVRIPPGKVRPLLTTLLLDANTAVPVDRLIEVMWDGRPTASAANGFHNTVLRLRRALGDEAGERIRSLPAGYLIRIETGELDVDTFLGLYASGREHTAAGHWAEASADFAAALALWRGSPDDLLAALPAHETSIHRLVEARSQALEGRIEADLELGRHAEVTEELRGLAAENPLREGPHRQLMLALYRTRRGDEALAVYRRLRDRMADELGMEPSASLQTLDRRIQDGDPALGAPAARFRLPADVRGFVGRESELDRLVELAAEAPTGTEAGMVVISAIDGMGGIGKTALAVHLAHRLRGRFPDGQLFLDLHGYATDLEPLGPGDALDWFLRALGVPPQSLPQDLGLRAAFYRDRLAGTRTLIILDNAASAAQVRPLLPDTPGCLVLVTSRRRLTGLDDAHAFALDTLTEGEAAALLHLSAGPGRLPAHHPAIGELVALCGHVPLAIRIAGARLRRFPELAVEDVVAQLRDDSVRLEHLQDGERDLATLFDRSYRDLDEDERLMFRRLGLLPGPDFDAHGAANLAGTDHRSAERLVESLLDRNLLVQHTLGRYRFHDLIRVYARGLAAADPAEDREAAIDRLLRYYRHTAGSADRRLARYTRPNPAPAGPEPGSAPDLADYGAALAWMRAELDNLTAAIGYAGAHAQVDHMIGLTSAFASFFYQEGPWAQAIDLHSAAVAAAQESGDRLGEADALSDLGRVRHMTGDHTASLGLPQRALEVYRELGHRQGEANAQWELGRVRRVRGDFAEATDLLERALSIYRDLGDRLGEANALWDLARTRHMTGDSAAATGLLEQSLPICQELGHDFSEANALADLGRAHQITGEYARAEAMLDQAQIIYRRLGSRLGEANTLSDLGRIRLTTGDPAASRALHERALSIYQAMGTRLNQANALAELARTRQAEGGHEAAADLYDRALAVYRAMGSRLGEANTVSDIGRIRQAVGDRAAAAGHYDRALAIYHDLGVRQGKAEVLVSMGGLAAEDGRPQDALELYRSALELAREVFSPIDEAHALEGSARCRIHTADRAAAVADLGAAVDIYRRLRVPEVNAASALLAELARGDEAKPVG